MARGENPQNEPCFCNYNDMIYPSFAIQHKSLSAVPEKVAFPEKPPGDNPRAGSSAK